jgi:hypothetical protein
MSLRAYARRRAELGLAGVSTVAVSKAIKGGRLKASVIRDARGQPKIADPVLADREWNSRTSLPVSEIEPLISRLVEAAEALRATVRRPRAGAPSDTGGTHGDEG